MNLSLARLLLHALAVLACALPITSSAGTNGWEIAKYQGREYVSINSIKRFYGFNKFSKNGQSLNLQRNHPTDKRKGLDVKLKIGGNECLMNGVKFVLCHPVTTINGTSHISRMDLAKLIDPVLRPTFIKNAGNFRTVILDPGHGGKDPGATNSLGTEATYNLKVAGKTKKLLEAKGFRVIMTRNSNTYLSLQQRVDIANRVTENAIFVSIHFNSGGRSARGIETFTLSPPGVSHYGRSLRASDAVARTGNKHDSANIALATAVHGSILRNNRIRKHIFDRGIKRARFSVLSGVRHPAILLEGGFMSHPYEARLIANDTYQTELARSIVDAIAKYRYAVTVKPATAQR